MVDARTTDRPYLPAFTTVEDVAAHWAEINDTDGAHIPTDLMSWSAAFTAHLPPGATRR